jgi:hypothetical protein
MVSIDDTAECLIINNIRATRKRSLIWIAEEVYYGATSEGIIRIIHSGTEHLTNMKSAAGI